VGQSQLPQAHEGDCDFGRGGPDYARELLRGDAGESDGGSHQDGVREGGVLRQCSHDFGRLDTEGETVWSDLGGVLDGNPRSRNRLTDRRGTELNGLHWVLQDFAGGGQRPRGVSPVAVYGYHTRLFSLAAPKLSCLTGISVPQIFESIRYEAYGPGGAALIVACLTDNRERTASLLRQVLLRFGGLPGARGSVDYLFNQVGLMVFPPGMKEGRLKRLALDAGAEEVVANPDGSVEVLTDPIEFEAVRARLLAGNFLPARAEVTQRASTPVRLEGEAAASMVQLVAALKDLDDVENVYTNAEIPDEVLARF
jgi:hypothetical protein